jgi:dihydroorotase
METNSDCKKGDVMWSQDRLIESITGEKQEIVIPRWFDRHLHVRDGEMMENVLPYTLNQRAIGAVIMGNHPTKTTSIKITQEYKNRIELVKQESISRFLGFEFAGSLPNKDFQPRMTCYLTDETTPEELVQGFQEGIWCAVKLYMADQRGEGGTTGSQHGVKNLRGRYKVFEAMEKHGIPLLGHFEAVEADVDEFDREIVSCGRDLEPILKTFPDLPVVFEHITDGRVAEFIVDAGYNVYATVTAHHLMLNRNDMFRGGMNPGNYCRPVPKREEHRLQIRRYVTSGNQNFGAGTDSAPHDKYFKSQLYGCAAGIFTAPCAVELYTTIFNEDNALDYLGDFLSKNFVELYGIKVSEEMMTIKRQTWTVPEKIGSVPVFWGGQTLPWKLVD